MNLAQVAQKKMTDSKIEHENLKLITKMMEITKHTHTPTYHPLPPIKVSSAAEANRKREKQRIALENYVPFIDWLSVSPVFFSCFVRSVTRHAHHQNQTQPQHAANRQGLCRTRAPGTRLLLLFSSQTDELTAFFRVDVSLVGGLGLGVWGWQINSRAFFTEKRFARTQPAARLPPLPGHGDNGNGNDTEETDDSGC